MTLPNYIFYFGAYNKPQQQKLSCLNFIEILQVLKKLKVIFMDYIIN